MSKKILRIIKPGDILLTKRHGNLISDAIAEIGDSDPSQERSHTVIYLGNGRIIEANQHGVVLGKITPYFSGFDITGYRLIDEASREAFVLHARLKSGCSYSFGQNILDLLFILIYQCTGIDLMRAVSADLFPTSYNCSELAAASFIQATGRRLCPDKAAAFVVPEDIGMSPEVFPLFLLEKKRLTIF